MTTIPLMLLLVVNSVFSVFFYDCIDTDNGYSITCNWNAGTIYRGCLPPDIHELRFAYFDQTSVIDLTCGQSVDAVLITTCENVCMNLGTILRVQGNHIIRVFCSDEKYVCKYIEVYCFAMRFSSCCSHCIVHRTLRLTCAV